MPIFSKYRRLALFLGLLFSFPTVGLYAASDDLLTLVGKYKEVNAKKVEAAFAAMATVQNAGAYINSFSELLSSQVVTLPVGIRHNGYELILRELSYNNVTGKNRVLASCAFSFKEDGTPIAFEGYVDIEGQKGLGTSGSLELITPVRRDMGSNLILVFNRGTRVNFSCDGVESFFAKMDLVVNSDKFFPVDANGKPSGGWLTASFESFFDDFDNFSINFEFGQSFAFEGLDGFVFSLRGATLDQSDLFTPATARFPDGYFPSGDMDARNLWKGVAITSATVTLPGFFSKPGVQIEEGKTTALADRITLGLEDVVLDRNGFTGKALAQSEMFSSSLLDKESWGISLSEFSLELLKNSVAGLGFRGDINIPPFGKNSLLPYHAFYNLSTKTYEFEVGIHGQFEFPALGCTLDLNRNSYVEVLVKDGGIYPTINACGVLSINAPLGDGEDLKRLKIPDIPFENMRISRAAPYFEIGAVGLTGEFASPEIAGFQLFIEDIKPINNHKGSGLAFEAGVILSDVFGGKVDLELYGNYSKWKFDRVEVGKVIVDYESSAFSVKGLVEFKSGDEVYGSGFRGDVKFEMLEIFAFDAVGVFGKKDDYRYFLTDVFYETSPERGIVLAPVPISFYGFGGGLYRKMQQTSSLASSSNFGKSLSGINYKPDRSVGMGFMTSTKFGMLAVPSAFNAKVSFEIQFNQDGGMNFVQLRGDAAFMDSPAKWGKMSESIKSAVGKLESAGGELNPSTKSELGIPENKTGGFLTASILMEYDAANKVFNADLNSYLNAGFIKGVGPDGRMGWASIRVARDQWYAHIGTPRDRLGIEILKLARTEGYFMLGDNIPELPPPPQNVLRNFSRAKQERLNSRSDYEIAEGKGIAFGQSLSIKFNAEMTPFYARMGAGLGAEFLLKNYGANAFCAGSEPPLGINGWYARAQAWAWVEADIGLQARVFGSRRRFSILDISAAALLEGAGPNPLYFAGTVGGRFSVMGGLISGRCDFGFEIGDECRIVSGSPFGDDIIAQLTPSAEESDVNVFVAPQVIFSIPVGLEMEVEEDQGKKAWYRVTLDEFRFFHKATGKEVEGARKFSDEGRVLVFDSHDVLESQSDYVVRAKVGFERRVTGNWSKVTGHDGKPVFEEKEVTFKSGDRPKVILPEHIKYSYPINRQYNFYTSEYDKGYLLLSKNYDYLFTTDAPEGFRQEIRLTDSNGNAQSTTFTYSTNTTGSDIRMEIDFSLSGFDFRNNEIYNLEMLNVPNTISGLTDNISTNITNISGSDSLFVRTQQAEGSLLLLQEEALFSIHFRSSSYKTFAEKMGGFEFKKNGFRLYIEPFVHELGVNMRNFELFDDFEIEGGLQFRRLIDIHAIVNETEWFNKSIYPLVYQVTPESVIKANRVQIMPSGIFHSPPVNSVFIEQYNGGNRLQDHEIRTGRVSGLIQTGSVKYALPFVCSRDYYASKAYISRKSNLNADELKIIKSDFPERVIKGDYPIVLKYSLPGRNIVTSTIQTTIFNPID